METKQPLLSICIPTYNRCEILKENLDNLISLNEFDDEVQLIVNDNASTDNTEEVVSEIIKRNPTKNIKYFKNEENIKDLNFYYVLNNGDGIYCKLLNDYVCLSDSSLYQMKEIVKNYKDVINTYLILCLNLNNVKLNSEGYINCDNANEMILTLHNKLTWISNFGCFKSQINELEPYLQNWHSMLLQIYWHINLAKGKKNIAIYSIAKWQSIPLPNSGRKSPYNFFQAHVANYYDIIDQSISLSNVEKRKDKTFLLSDFVGLKAVDYLILNKDCPFDLTGSWRILWKYFKDVPYFYIFIPLRIFRMVKHKLNRILKSMFIL